MSTRSHRPTPTPARYLRALLALVLTVGILWVAKPIIVPLALAVLLAFVLNPLVVSAQQRGLGRVPAVLITVGLTLFIVVGVGYGVGAQLTKLADDLPSHKDEIHAKVMRLRGHGAGPWSKLMDTFKQATEDAAHPPTTQPTVTTAGPPQSSFEQLGAIAAVVLEPLADAGLILILVIFMLIRREDLRNRVIGLLGHGRLTGTTRVLVESAERISRLLLMQLCLNTAFGIIFAIALLLLGVPYWFLWGFLTVVLRFVPYVGSWMSAAPPILLSVAIAPGWLQPLMVLAVFVTLDLVTANVVEPLVFGHSTGVSPVALLIAAAFWTWLWGPIGLVLSTPMTVCMVVLGQNAPRLKFLSLLLGDQPALGPPVAYYQRLLAGDRHEATVLATRYADAEGVAKLPDDMLLPAVRLARRDRQSAGLNAEDEGFILDTTEEILDKLAPSTPTAEPATGATPLVIGCAAHHKSEELAVRMIASTFKPDEARVEPISTRTLPADVEAKVEQDHPAALFVAIVPPGGMSQARYLCRRLRRKFPELPIVVGYFGRFRDFDKLLTRLRAAGASYVTTSVTQTRSQLLTLLAPPPLPAPAPVSHAINN